MASKIIAGTSAGSALVLQSDTSGALEFQTGAVPTTAMSVSAAQAVVYPGSVTFNGTATFSGTPSFPTAVPVSSGGTGATTLTGYVKGTGTTAMTASASVPTTDITGTLPVANGGTGLTATPTNGQLDIGNGTGFTRAALTAGSNITITNGAGSISIAATVPASVTSVATGNGLSGGTITSTGTLVVACPGFNTVGSYCGIMSGSAKTAGSNYAAGSAIFSADVQDNSGTIVIGQTTELSGTWKWMGATNGSGATKFTVGCRVS